MVAIRVIPCLDVSGGRVVKGVNFTNLRDAGDPVELARAYGEQGADELTFLDISASVEGRDTTVEMVKRCADEIFIPMTVGGGISSVEHVERLLEAGADKISLNTAALRRPELLGEIAEKFGRQVTVLSVDARRIGPGADEGATGAGAGEGATGAGAGEGSTPSGFEVTTHGGQRGTGIDALEWITRACQRGIGEVLLNSMDADGTTAGFDVEMIQAARAICPVPLIASGGAGKIEHFHQAVAAGADAVLAASVFHFGTFSIGEVKADLARAGYEVRNGE